MTTCLDADTLSDSYRSLVRFFTQLHNDSYALVPTDLFVLWLELVREGSPGVGHDAHIGVADAGVCAIFVISMNMKESIGCFRL